MDEINSIAQEISELNNQINLYELNGNLVYRGENPNNNVIKWNYRGFKNGTICIVNAKKEAIHSFDGLKEAIDWVMENFVPSNQREVVKRETLEKNIRKAYSGGSLYCGHRWRIVTNETVD